MVGDLRQRNAAIVRHFKQAAGLGAHNNGCHIDQGHENARKNTGAQYILRHIGIVCHTHGPNDINDHNAKGQTGNGIHGAITFHEGREKRTVLISRLRFHRGHSRTGFCQCRNHQNGQKRQKQRVDDFADPHGDARRTQGEKQYQQEKYGRKDQQGHFFRGAAAQHRNNARGKGRGCASGNGKKRADGQVQQTGKEIAVASAHLIGQRLQAVGMSHADGRHTQNRNANRCDDKANGSRNHIAAGKLSQMNREDQITRSKKHAEQRCRHQQLLRKSQSFSHSVLHLSLFFILYHAPCTSTNDGL